MVIKNLFDFCERNEEYRLKFDKILTLKELNVTDYENVLNILSDYLLNPNCTKDVADCFPQLLPALVTIAIPMGSVHSYSSYRDLVHKRNCIVLSKLINTNPDLLTYVLQYFDSNPAPFESEEKFTQTKKPRSQEIKVSDYDIVLACYNILSSATTHFKHKWNWSKFYKFLKHKDNRVKWIALKCISIILGMSEAVHLSCAAVLIGDIKEFLIEYEEKNVEPLALENLTDSMKNIMVILKDFPSLTSIGNILLPVFNPNKITNDVSLVSVPSMEESLQSLAIALASRKCICLQGSVGCGKTALVEYLAEITGHDSSNFIKVQLGDQTDSKMLLGMYRCTDIPGEFVWQPGVLTQAVIAGKWLLLEDIDSAALDVASVLSNLLETGTLSVPGYRDNIYARSGFQLFVTQRLMPSVTGLKKQISSASSLLQKHWFCINVEGFSLNELIILVQTLFPALKTVANRMIDVFLLFSMGDHDGRNNAFENSSLKTGRQISTRDLMKWCSRAIVDFDVSLPNSALKIFQDAIDIFCCSVSDQGQRLNLVKTVADKLGIVKTKAEYFCNMYKPSISLNLNFFIAGRTKLLCKKSEYVRMMETKTTFSFTRPSACLLERIACCVAQKEPVLLVGETGTGKTSSIQYLAQSTGHKLIVINMNQQSESADLLGGYKPVELKFLISPIREEFLVLFRSYFALEPNRKFLEHIALCYKQQRWKTLVTLMSYSTNAALKKLKHEHCQKKESILMEKNETSKKKKRDEDDTNEEKIYSFNELLIKWEKLSEKLEKLELQVKAQYSLAFSFVEGSLIKALKEGYWVLLDEINLANAETLECLSGLLEKSSGSLSLLERGDNESIKRHSDFTVFACMNPATDIGKKDLPIGLRNRFTEFYVDELTERSDLQLLVHSYLKNMNLSIEKQEAIVKFYLNVRKEAVRTLLDGTGHKPHYSLRTLCRALSIAGTNPCGNITRSLYEAFCLSFLTQLNYDSHPIVEKMISSAILDNKNLKAILGCPISKPKYGNDEDYIYFEGYWIVKGTLAPKSPNNYILTKTVRRNLKDLVRVVSIGKIPVLLQGDTSVGKTSLITYLAKASGNICVRINNHEHTDLQEYVGSYVADETGKLVFREGILVEAMRKGHWIILDELNLAPSDVLEALNRVLDDNRELFIPTTQQVVKAHDNFMLFATQNPPGLYGGRKVLSRAFRNRFVELHFDEIPSNELQIILHERCQMPESYCKQVINVMTDLQIRRKSTAAFAGKQGFITLRDLFRWGERYRLAPNIIGDKLYDWSQHLADEGYLVLAAKVRKMDEADEIRKVIKKHLKRDVDPNNLFSLNDKTSTVTRHILEQILDKNNAYYKHIVWTYHMRRMAVLVKKSCQFKEPVLLVGETGCGKTTVCQLIAAMNEQTMRSINCHMHTESSDFLGNLRPVRERNNVENSKLFEWIDGPLIIAMQMGDLFLADEISLADDSVLERLNSLLEPERSLLLAEKGLKLKDEDDNSTVMANDKFIFIGTMNPGGDYGKKELSPALRNRFTEIWCEPCIEMNDLNDIIIHNLDDELSLYKQSIAKAILSFIQWLPTTDVGKKLIVSIRDILTWLNFINICTCNETIKLNISDAYYHGGCLTYIDGLGSGLTSTEKSSNLIEFRDAALSYIKYQIKDTLCSNLSEEFDDNINVSFDNINNTFGIKPFYIKRGSSNVYQDMKFTFSPNTTKLNALKLLRALQLNKPILLEGSPGVGKTSIVSALAKASGNALFRINLSDQTDISDLFGADLPVEGGQGGEFSWRDGPFLRALKAGEWILLDELNLASQSVLEGLNACFDHRGEIYIPELGKTFSVKSGTRLFGCQNPLKQGGARRGLPKSFLNRFTQVFIDTLTEDDLMFILNVQFPQLSGELIKTMVKFNSVLASEIGVNWGHIGSPWELNLRDISRWCELTVKEQDDYGNDFKRSYYNPGNTVEIIYVSRMRTQEDKQRVRQLYQEYFPIDKYPLSSSESSVYITEETLYIDDVKLAISQSAIYNNNSNLLLLRDQRTTLKQLMQCINMNWMSILVGASGCGKSNVVRLLASLVGQKLRCIVVNSAMDTTEILGGFEQIDYNRHLEELLERTEDLLLESLKRKIHSSDLEQLASYHGLLEKVKRLSDDENDNTRTMASETQLFLRKNNELSKLVSKIKTLEPSYEFALKEIEIKLKSLSTFVEKEKCLNAGGKFEWVDSVLVKCLRDGTWLLIDQVNLCSPAVLDRLNGLLEPNGVLTIGERGVDNHGNVITIKPHKNFRLFLTMDPHYGEISRAMRNRGVEIYMIGPKENIHYDLMDMKSMLYHYGITKCQHQRALVDIYERMSKEIVTIDKLNIVDLMHSAFLVARRLTRGFPSRQAIRIACIDVYIKGRSTRTPEIKEFLISVIEEIIDTFVISKSNNDNFIDFDAATWTIKNIQDNTKLTIIRQEGVLLKSAIDIYKSNPMKNDLTPKSCYWNDIIDLIANENMEILNVDIKELLPYLLIDIYERSTLNDVEIRNLWLTKMFIKDDTLKDLTKKNNLLASEVLSFDFHISKRSLPWDLAFLPGIAVNDRNDEVMNDANKLALLLYLRTMIIMDDTILDESLVDEKENTMSVKQYSNAIYHNKLTSNLKNQPLIIDYVKLVYQTNASIHSLLRDNALLIDNETYVEFRQGLKYCNRFLLLGEMTLINKSSRQIINLEEMTLLLRVHYKWLIKFIYKLYQINKRKFSMISERTINEMNNFFVMINEINQSLSSTHDPFRKITKLIKKHLTLPLPHISETSMNVHFKMRKIIKSFLPWIYDGTNDQLIKKELKIISIQTNDAITIRYQIISLWNRIYSNPIMDSNSILHEISKIEEFCESNHLDLHTPMDVSTVLEKINSIDSKELIKISSNIQLSPIYEYLFLLLAHNSYRQICENTINDETSLQYLLENFAKVPNIPANLIAILSTIFSNEIDSNQRMLLMYEFCILLSQFTQNSYAMKDSKMLLHWNGISNDDVETSVITYDILKANKHVGGGILMNLILELIMQRTDKHKEDTILTATTLGSYTSRIEQLNNLNNILWRNSVTLTSKYYNIANNDFHIMKFYLNLYMSAVEDMYSENDVDKLIVSTIEKQGKHNQCEINNTYINEYQKPIEELREIRKKLMNVDINIDIIERGRTWMLIGYFELLIFGNLSYIDPVHKINLKLKCLEEDIKDCKIAIYINRLQSYILKTSLCNENIHPRYLAMRKYLETISKERDNLKLSKAFRSSMTDFTMLTKDIINFRNTIASYETVYKHIDRLTFVINKINEKPSKESIKIAEDALREAEMWYLSLERFTEQIDIKYYSFYPDIILPLLVALIHLKEGISLLINETKKEISSIIMDSNKGNLEIFIYNMIRYPTIGLGQDNLLHLVDTCQSNYIKLMISKTLRLTADTSMSVKEQFRIVKCGLYELYNYILLNRNLSMSHWKLLNELLQQLVTIWKQQEEEAEKLAIEKESLYRNKSIGKSSNEDDDLISELQYFFPTYREKDFNDIENIIEFNLEDNVISTELKESCVNIISNDDIKEIQQIHSNVVTSFVKSEWIFRDNDNVEPNYIRPLLQRYEIARLLLNNNKFNLNENFTSKLYNSLHMLVSQSLRITEDENTQQMMISMIRAYKKSYDFYKDSNIQQVKQCLPLCKCILTKINEFLKQWSEHPTLKSIKCIIERIYNFPITSPLARFLTGLELLLVKLHQWEENAHVGVSLSNDILTLTQQIISWRKLELTCWKNCLDTAFENLRSQTSKWWFYLYALIESYIFKSISTIKTSNIIKENESINKEKLIELLERFINESPIVEFETRLDLLLTFHCHVLYFQPSAEKEDLLAILWNIYNYYKQFVQDVNTKIHGFKVPIEKKLKDFVKIARWNDINYWSVKETVEKTHRTLHKFIKEYENVLKQNVLSCLTVTAESCNANLRNDCKCDNAQKEYPINPNDFIISDSIMKNINTKDIKFKLESININNQNIKYEFVSSIGKLLNKAKCYCKEIILTSSYPSIRMDIENFIQDYIEQSIHLRNIEIDRSLSKSKQKSQAKSILQQKKMILANYFKALNLMGVSYRTGILTWKNDMNKVIDFTISPLDISVITKYFNLSNIDEQMLIQWSGCDKYYYKSIIKLNALNAILRSTQTDLGQQNIERCRGYSCHIMLLANKQRLILSKLFNYFKPLRVLVRNLLQIDNIYIDISNEFQNNIKNIKESMINVELSFVQLLLYLQCSPNKSSFEIHTDTLVLEKNTLPILDSCDDIILDNIKIKLNENLNLIRKIGTIFNSAFISTNVKDMINEKTFDLYHLKVLEDTCKEIAMLKMQVNALFHAFSSTNAMHPIVESITFLQTQIECSINAFNELKKLPTNKNTDLCSNDADCIKRSIDNLIKDILLVVQKKYKANTSEDDKRCLNDDDDDNDNDEKDVDDDFEQNKLKEKLIEDLEKNIEELKISHIYELVKNLLFKIGENQDCKRLILQCLPIMEQYLLLVQFYLNEQVASFRVTCKLLYLQLNVFLDLATNGFCVPKDLDIEEGDTEESGDNVKTGGMGLGEGEGQKDVSDRIESEDQLEDAKRADEEEQKSEEKDCKEEDKGIEMSENFDSKLQDIEKDENNEKRDDDEEDDDLDKEMGETEEGAEQLDKEIWGDDEEEESENENNQSSKDKEEERGQGEEIGDKEITAKDGSNKEDRRDDEKEHHEDEQRSEEEKKEINEINEPEYNDDQIDPYHGKHQPQPEPEPFDLPEDMNLDNDDDNEKEENHPDNENPFDIDDMKDSKPPPENENTDSIEEKNEQEEKIDLNDDSSDDDDDETNEKGEQHVNQDDEEKIDEDADPKGTLNQKQDTNNEEERDEEKKDEETEKKEELEEKVAPSVNDASKELDASEQIDSSKDGTKDNVIQESQAEQYQEKPTENNQDDSKNNGVGQSQSERQESGHAGSSIDDTNTLSQQEENKSKQMNKRKNLGTADENRSLLDKTEPERKKSKMIHSQEEILEREQEDQTINKDKDDIDMCQHIKNSDQFDDYAMDAATENQLKQQASNMEDEENKEKKEEEEEDMDVDLHKDENDDLNKEEDNIPKQNPEKLLQDKKEQHKNDSSQKGNNTEMNQMETNVEIEGDFIETVKVERGNDTTFHTNMDIDNNGKLNKSIEITRTEVEKMLSEWTYVPSTEEATIAWNYLSMVTDSAARGLSEKLRLVLEPTKATRLKGDYRTGRRINMRKIIPYIASQFRKDKIWLRRTKPSKRDYQIVLALDDSSSMADNHSKELAFESLSLISKAMTYLEVGQLCVISFGERVSVLHPLGETFTEQSGSRLIQEMRFEQKKTSVGQLVDFTVDMFETQSSSSDNAKLVVVLSDGRGIFSEGSDKVNHAVRRAKMADIFLVFIIVDNPINKDSILDIRMPVFEDGKLLSIRSYMDSFPFPFYMILRDINMLPGVLSDALRQWFEVVGKIDT
ncbi:midasin isoform X1 [Vespa crabro]|uniref:midasin isoform X1 n=2 Tax=Vespa crabro TaxID=7445 RepID=UPI001F017237|nr:midasin isoform X1 [Vespa crabro]